MGAPALSSPALGTKMYKQPFSGPPSRGAVCGEGAAPPLLSSLTPPFGEALIRQLAPPSLARRRPSPDRLRGLRPLMPPEVTRRGRLPQNRQPPHAPARSFSKRPWHARQPRGVGGEARRGAETRPRPPPEDSAWPNQSRRASRGASTPKIYHEVVCLSHCWCLFLGLCVLSRV